MTCPAHNLVRPTQHPQSMILAATTCKVGRSAPRQSALPPRIGLVRRFSRSGFSLNASQPATPSTSTTTNPHAARVAAAGGSNNTSRSDARSRLAKLQAQRLEELNRGRSGAGGARPNKPEQKWSNRTLIALATSVGACTYLMGTYHGYNAGKQHAFEASVSSPGIDVVPGATQVPPSNGGSSQTGSLQTSSLSQSLLSLLPLSNLSSSIHCEPSSEKKSSCRLAELTQYHCDLHTNRVVCQPIDRILRM